MTAKIPVSYAVTVRDRVEDIAETTWTDMNEAIEAAKKQATLNRSPEKRQKGYEVWKLVAIVTAEPPPPPPIEVKVLMVEE